MTTESLPALDRVSIDHVMTEDGRVIHFETMPVGSLPDRIWDAVLERYNAHRALVAALRGLLDASTTDPEDCKSHVHHASMMEHAQETARAALKEATPDA